MVLREHHLYIRAPHGDQVLTGNSLDASLLPEGKATQLMNSSKPVDLWITYFLSLTAPKQGGGMVSGVPMSGSSSTGSEWEDVGLQGAGSPPSLEDFERARDNLRTPKQLKVGPLLASLVDTSPAGGVDLAPLEDLESLADEATEEERDDFIRDSLKVILEDWSRVKGNFELLNRELENQGVSESQFRDVLASTISALQSVTCSSPT